MNKREVESLGYQAAREVPGHGICALARMVYTVGLVVGINELGYRGRYCYHSLAEARKALGEWNGRNDPPGNWIKFKGEGGDRPNPRHQ